MKKAFYESFYWLRVAVVGLVVGLGVQFTQAWVAAPTGAPNNNVQGPVTTGSNSQEKSGSLTVNNHLTVKNGTSGYPYIYLNRNGNIQALVGTGAYLYHRSANSDYTGMVFQDKESTMYGRVYGSGNGAYFGLLDGDNHWSYLAAKDNYTQFRINNSAIMTMRSNGNVGIGTTSPSEKLYVSGNIKASGSVCNGSGKCIGSGGGDNLGNHTATQNLNMNNRKVTRVATPTSGTDAANKAYVDARVGGINPSADVRLAMGPGFSTYSTNSRERSRSITCASDEIMTGCFWYASGNRQMQTAFTGDNSAYSGTWWAVTYANGLNKNQCILRAYRVYSEWPLNGSLYPVARCVRVQ